VEAIDDRGRYLKLVYDYLLSIPGPTSVEAKRAFSASGVICSRLRTRLGGRDIGCIVLSSVVFPEAAALQLNDA